jgi:hypothetical protein
VAPLPPALEARIAALEAESLQPDFGSIGWFWMILLCVFVPLGLLLLGWHFIPGRF